MWSAPLPRCVGTWSAAFIPFSLLFVHVYCRIYAVTQVLNVFWQRCKLFIRHSRTLYLSGLQLKALDL